MAVCNTVVVAKKPHRDRMMNDDGVPMNQSMVTTVDCSNHNNHAAGDDEEGSIITISEREPSPSIDSSSMSSTTLIIPPVLGGNGCGIVSSSSSVSNVTPKRPGNLFFFTGRPSSRYRPSTLLAHQQQHSNVQRPLSPIDSSAETTPSESPAPPLRPRFLQLPSLASAHSFFSLRRSSTPTSDHSSLPATPSSDRKHLYEAESPDELALVDAACTYNIRLLQRSVHHVVVSLPGKLFLICFLHFGSAIQEYLVTLMNVILCRRRNSRVRSSPSPPIRFCPETDVGRSSSARNASNHRVLQRSRFCYSSSVGVYS